MIFRKYLTERNAVAMWKYDFDNNLAQNISEPQQQLGSVQTYSRSHMHACVCVIPFDLEFINQIMWRLTVSLCFFVHSNVVIRRMFFFRYKIQIFNCPPFRLWSCNFWANSNRSWCITLREVFSLLIVILIWCKAKEKNDSNHSKPMDVRWRLLCEKECTLHVRNAFIHSLTHSFIHFSECFSANKSHATKTMKNNHKLLCLWECIFYCIVLRRMIPYQMHFMCRMILFSKWSTSSFFCRHKYSFL